MHDIYQSDKLLGCLYFIPVINQYCDLTHSLSLLSPKVLSSLAQLHHGSGSSSSSPTGNGFITKEAFAAHVPSRTTPVKTRRDGGSPGAGGPSGCEARC